jgi:hypothetical protein
MNSTRCRVVTSVHDHQFIFMSDAWDWQWLKVAHAWSVYVRRSRIILNAGTYLPNYTASHPRRSKFSFKFLYPKHCSSPVQYFVTYIQYLCRCAAAHIRCDMTPESRNSQLLDNGSLGKYPRQRIVLWENRTHYYEINTRFVATDKQRITEELSEMVIYIRFGSKL